MSEKNNVLVVQKGFEAVTARDLEEFKKLLAPNFHLYLILKPDILRIPEKLVGAKAFEGYLRRMFTAFPDLSMETNNMEANGDVVYHELTIHGTHQGPLGLPNNVTVPATNQSITIDVEVFNNFSPDGEFINSTAYANLFEIAKQFGKDLLSSQ